VADRIEKRSIVSLKVSRNSLDSARERLSLAGPLQDSGGDPRRLWIGPAHWLLVSDTTTADVIVDTCRQALAGILHNAVDYSAAMAVFRLTGHAARQLLATGTGVDLRPAAFPAGSCCRTRLAQIAAVITVDTAERFEIYVDRSYETFLMNWLVESSSICSSYLRASQN
jgi:sarcosine oxidase subunit gamma